MKIDPICSDRDLPVSRRIRTGLLISTLMVAGFGGWLVFASLSSAVVASAQIGQTSDRKPVQHLDGGIVAEVLVRDGAIVEAGIVLMRMDGAALSSERAILVSTLDEISARIDRLKSEEAGHSEIKFRPSLLSEEKDRPELAAVLAAQRELFSSRALTVNTRSEQLQSRKDQLSNRIKGISAQLSGLRKRISITEAEFERQSSLLQKGLTQTSRVGSIEMEIARMQAEIGSLKAQEAEAEGRIQETDTEMMAVTASRMEDVRQELSELSVKEKESTERLSAVKERIDRLEVKSPISGVVHQLMVHSNGQVIRPADPVMFIIPAAKDMRMTARVSPQDIDYVRKGQTAHLTFPAFRAADLPQIEGEVIRVAPDLTTDQATGMSWYEVNIALTDQGRADLTGLDLVPGMPVESFIQTGGRSPMRYLMEPLTGFLDRALREP